MYLEVQFEELSHTIECEFTELSHDIKCEFTELYTAPGNGFADGYTAGYNKGIADGIDMLTSNIASDNEIDGVIGNIFG